jgi:hypothetical protein
MQQARSPSPPCRFVRKGASFKPYSLIILRDISPMLLQQPHAIFRHHPLWIYTHTHPNESPGRPGTDGWSALRTKSPPTTPPSQSPQSEWVVVNFGRGMSLREQEHRQIIYPHKQGHEKFIPRWQRIRSTFVSSQACARTAIRK